MDDKSGAKELLRIVLPNVSYAQLFFSENTRSQAAGTFKSRAEGIDVDAANRVLFFELWWKSLDSEK